MYLELDRLKALFDIDEFKKWNKEVEQIKEEVYQEIIKAIDRKFEIIKIPKNISLNTFCSSYVCNLVCF